MKNSKQGSVAVIAAIAVVVAVLAGGSYYAAKKEAVSKAVSERVTGATSSDASSEPPAMAARPTSTETVKEAERPALLPSAVKPAPKANESAVTPAIVPPSPVAAEPAAAAAEDALRRLGISFATGYGAFDTSTDIFVPKGMEDGQKLRLAGEGVTCDFLSNGKDSAPWTVRDKNAAFPGFPDKGWLVRGWIAGTNCSNSRQNKLSLKDGVYEVRLMEGEKVLGTTGLFDAAWQEEEEELDMDLEIIGVRRIAKEITLKVKIDGGELNYKNAYFDVDWGDGETSDHPVGSLGGSGIDVEFAHKYYEAGTYTVAVDVDLIRNGQKTLYFKDELQVVIGGFNESCTDTDGGDNPGAKGTVKRTHADGSTAAHTDICDGAGQALLEGYCGPGDDSLSIHVECPHGCLDGACVEE